MRRSLEAIKNVALACKNVLYNNEGVTNDIVQDENDGEVITRQLSLGNVKIIDVTDTKCEAIEDEIYFLDWNNGTIQVC